MPPLPPTVHTHPEAVKECQELMKSVGFRDLMDNINQNNSDVKNVHIFYSGQPSLAFILGSSISKRMDKNIFVHNHTGTETPKYSWGIKLHKSDDKKNVIFCLKNSTFIDFFFFFSKSH